MNMPHDDLKYDLNVPGTTLILDEVAEASGSDNFTLVPTPSTSPDDPLNWSQGRKWIQLGCIVAYVLAACLCAGCLYAIYGPVSDATGLSLAQINSGVGFVYLFEGLMALFTLPLTLCIGKRPVYIASCLLIAVFPFALGAVSNNGAWIGLCIIFGFSASPLFVAPEASLSSVVSYSTTTNLTSVLLPRARASVWHLRCDDVRWCSPRTSVFGIHLRLARLARSTIHGRRFRAPCRNLPICLPGGDKLQTPHQSSDDRVQRSCGRDRPASDERKDEQRKGGHCRGQGRAYCCCCSGNALQRPYHFPVARTPPVQIVRHLKVFWRDPTPRHRPAHPHVALTDHLVVRSHFRHLPNLLQLHGGLVLWCTLSTSI